MNAPRATARLQFHRGFTLDDAIPVVGYLRRLGISHLYTSPLLTARPGSSYGYDQIDPVHVNPELGGEPALRRLVAALRAQEMGLILDIVPNHMAVGGSENPWWRDVLEWGRVSPWAGFFDIDWFSATPGLRGRVLAPFLGRAYGACLEAGEITLGFDAAEGRLVVAYGDMRFPLAPRDYPDVLGAEGGVLGAVVRPLGALPRGRAAAREAAAAVRAALRAPELGPAIVGALARFAPAGAEGRGRLHGLLEQQAYRLAWWRTAEAINWRRFFDINGLAGMRVERAEVFAALHGGILRLYEAGLIDGVRVDHVDGLADPGGYCRRLRGALAAVAGRRPDGAPGGAAPVWVEKILAADEALPTEWRTDGTTGYDFMDQVALVLHDPDGAATLDGAWTAAGGAAGGFAAVVAAARVQILRCVLPGEVEGLAAALQAVAGADLRTRDDTLPAIRRVLEALLGGFPVYRIYAGPQGAAPACAAVMATALARARPMLRPADHALLDRMGSGLLGDGIAALSPSARALRLRAMVRFQQVSAPVGAKAVEDTAFYRYGRLLSRNEVGSDPGVLGEPPAAFHARMRARRRQWPRSLLASATHDHKRGEDARARLAVLSEIPELWAERLGGWLRQAAGWRDGAAVAPEPVDLAMLFQTMIGAWPLGLAADDGAGLAAFAERLAEWQRKALREARTRSDWALPDEAYEAACAAVLRRGLDPARSEGMTTALAGLVGRIAPAGALNGLAQTALRLTVPGVPDLYQGTEFWDFSLVDPDNRRAVDFAARQAALARGAAPAALLETWRDGQVKQALIARLLGLRARLPVLFAAGAYVPLGLAGPRARHVLAFARVQGDSAVVVVVSRLAARLPLAAQAPRVDPAVWGETAVVLPARLVGRAMEDGLGGSAVPAIGPRLPLAAVLRELPVGVLVLG